MALFFISHKKELCYIDFSHGKRGILLQIHRWGLHYKAFSHIQNEIMLMKF